MHSGKSPEFEIRTFIPYHKINLHFGLFHSVCHAISYNILLCVDILGRYKCKPVAFTSNLPVETEGFLRARTHQPEYGMSELV